MWGIPFNKIKCWSCLQNLSTFQTHPAPPLHDPPHHYMTHPTSSLHGPPHPHPTLPLVHFWAQRSLFSWAASLCLPFGRQPVVDPGFPTEGRQLPMLLHFVKFVCQNKRIWTLKGEHALAAPPVDPPMETTLKGMLRLPKSMVMLGRQKLNGHVSTPIQ